MPDLESFKAEINQAQSIRGWIVNSYAQVEFLIGDLLLRRRIFTEYDNFGEAFSHSSPMRVKQIKRLLLIPGPFDIFSERLLVVIKRFEEEHQTRNILVHGYCEFLYTQSGTTFLRFSKWHRVPGNDDAKLEQDFNIAALRIQETKSISLAQDALNLFSEIHQHFGWVGYPHP